MELPALLEEHGEIIEADLQRYYGVDLTGLWRGELTMRRALVLIRGLPPGAGFFRRHGGDMAWSYEEWAIREEGFRILSAIVSFAGMWTKRPVKEPKMTQPPVIGWFEKRQAANEKVRRKAERLRNSV